jgi:Na+-translocating ferredoxin:NAD+ oxidoreductase RnfG subunit
LREADVGGIKLSNAKQFAGATISPRQAAELVRALGLNVA